MTFRLSTGKTLQKVCYCLAYEDFAGPAVATLSFKLFLATTRYVNVNKMCVRRPMLSFYTLLQITFVIQPTDAVQADVFKKRAVAMYEWSYRV